MAMGGSGEDTVKPYPVVEELVRPVQWVEMPRAPRVVDPGACSAAAPGYLVHAGEVRFPLAPGVTALPFAEF